MAGLFGSVTIKGNRLTEFASQTATVGIPIPFGYGRYRVGGNVIFAPMPPKEHVTKKKQGKGGVKTETYTYTLSYAIGFCEGPIFGYYTIIRNGKVVWTQDPNATIEDKAYAAKWAQRATFYFGTEHQLPDSTIESYKGAGNVSAFRGIAYIVVEDDDVTEAGGAVPTYEAVVIASPPEVYLTSKPYAQYYVDTVDTSARVSLVTLHDALWTGYENEKVSYNPRMAGAYLGLALRVVNNDEKVSYLPTLVDGELRSQLKSFNAEEKISYSPTLVNGELRRQLVIYDQWEEKISYSPTLVDGELG